MRPIVVLGLCVAVGWACGVLLIVASLARAGTSVSAPQGGMPADPAQTLIRKAVAPFICGAARGGVYIDTTCAQVCVCVTADAKWARSDTGIEGSFTDCC